MIKSYIKNELSHSKDFIIKDISLHKKKITLIYNEVLIDIAKANEIILRPLFRLNKKELKDLINSLPNLSIKTIPKEDIITYLLQSHLIIIVNNTIYTIEIPSILNRGIQTIESELSVTGPKDSFTEYYNMNLLLLRKRIKSKYLCIDNISIGRTTKTKVGIVYMSNIAKEEIINSIKEKLNKIDIDGIIDSSYLKKALEKKNKLLPTSILTERPDKTSMALLEGKIAIITDMSPFVIITPSLFIDFFHTTDDYYQKSINTSFIRIIRFLAFLVAVFTPAIYISITTRNYNLIPYKLLLTLKAGRTFVPFPAYIEALFMLICFEILKESELRMSKTSSSQVSILGGLILGDAAVSAGIVSPIMIIVIAISSIASLTFQSLELGNALRNYKIFLLILSTLLGINGLIIGTTILIYELITTKVFGIPYLSPIIPLDKNTINDSLIKTDHKLKRNKSLTNNINRGKYKWKN